MTIMNEEIIVGRKGKGRLLKGLLKSSASSFDELRTDETQDDYVGDANILDYFREKEQIIFVLDEIIGAISRKEAISGGFQNDINDVCSQI
jgi:hypothetical protein